MGATVLVAMMASEGTAHADEPAPPPAPEAAPAQQAPQPQTAPHAAQTSVTLQSDAPETTMERLAASGVMQGYANGRAVTAVYEAYEPICTAPCTVAVDPHAQYRVVGPGVTPSEMFHVPDAGNVNVRVQSGSAIGHFAGSTMFVLGLTGALTGGILLGVGAGAHDDELANIGWLTLAGGAALAVPGFFLAIYTNTKVEVAQERGIALTKILSLKPSGILVF